MGKEAEDGEEEDEKGGGRVQTTIEPPDGSQALSTNSSVLSPPNYENCKADARLEAPVSAGSTLRLCLLCEKEQDARVAITSLSFGGVPQAQHAEATPVATPPRHGHAHGLRLSRRINPKGGL